MFTQRSSTFCLTALFLPRKKDCREPHTSSYCIVQGKPCSRISLKGTTVQNLVCFQRSKKKLGNWREALLTCHSSPELGSHVQVQKGRYVVIRRLCEEQWTNRRQEFETLVNQNLSAFHYGSHLAPLGLSLLVNGMGGHCFCHLRGSLW